MSIDRKFDPAIVREFFDYDDGNLIWKTRARHWFANARGCSIWNVRYPGTIAGYRRSDGYLNIRLSILGFDSSFRASHLVWVWHHGKWPDEQIDHIDHNRHNNRIDNLREVTNAENCKNKSLANVGSAGVFGVNLDARRGLWEARIQSGGEVFYLGAFKTKPEAVAARRAAERVLGFHRNHGRNLAA